MCELIRGCARARVRERATERESKSERVRERERDREGDETLRLRVSFSLQELSSYSSRVFSEITV